MTIIRVLAIFVLLAPGAVLAGPQFTAEDIINHFAKAQEAPAKPVKRSTGPVIAGSGGGTLSLPRTGNHKHETRANARDASGYDLLITFETGSDQLTPQARQNLEVFAKALQTPALAGFAFEVQGHTDAVGPASANQVLSERRALSVVSFLTGLGVGSERLQARGFGETQPLMTDPNHPDNRRVETRRIK